MRERGWPLPECGFYLSDPFGQFARLHLIALGQHNLMAHGGYRRLPIVDDQGRPTGIIKVEGIMHYLVEHFPSTVYNLPPNPSVVQQEREGA